MSSLRAFAVFLPSASLPSPNPISLVPCAGLLPPWKPVKELKRVLLRLRPARGPPAGHQPGLADGPDQPPRVGGEAEEEGLARDRGRPSAGGRLRSGIRQAVQ